MLLNKQPFARLFIRAKLNSPQCLATLPRTMTTRTYSLISHPYPTSHHKLPEPVETCNFLNNEFRSSKAQQWTEVADPATGHMVSRVPMSTDAELSAAVDSAEAAFPEWRDASVLKRQQTMFRYVNLIRSHWDRLAANITLEQGKTFADAKGDVLRGLQVAETACGITTQITGDVLTVAKDMETRSYKEPLGVVAAICPFSKFCLKYLCISHSAEFIFHRLPSHDTTLEYTYSHNCW